MKKIVMILGLALVLILAACRSQNVGESKDSLIPSTGNQTSQVPHEIYENEVADPVEDLPTEGIEGPGINPTPSPNFEQDYGPNEISNRDYSDLEIVTLLPPDAIPAFTFPEYYSVNDANREYAPDELVIGVEFKGDARAYSVSLLSRHEIVNDTVGGIHLAVTW